MKKLYFSIFLIFIFVSCVSNNYNILNPATPSINIEYKNNNYIISCSYRGNNWIFLNGVEIKNSNGDTKKLLFSKPRRNILDSGSVSEIGVFYPAFTDSFNDFLGSGDIYARPLAELKTYDLKKIEIINK